MGKKERKRKPEGGLAESIGDTDIDLLVSARSQTEAPLHRFTSDFSVLVIDLVGTPSFFERYGETAILVMLQQHNELVVPVVNETGGAVIKSVGDTALALFNTAREAARTAFHVHNRVSRYNADRPENERLNVRMGMTFASGSAENPQVLDAAIDGAANIAKECQPGQILCSPSYQKMIDGENGMATEEIPDLTVEAFAIQWTGQGAAPPMTESVQLEGTPRSPAKKAAPPELDATRQFGNEDTKTLGRYEIIEELGVGGMGVVYKAHDPTVDRKVAIKTVRLDAEGPEHDELVRRLRQEAQAAGRLEHPAVVTIYDAGEAKGVFYIAMQFVEGKILRSYLTEKTLLPVAQILSIMEETCDGLHYAHERGIVHRDLKPANIIVTPGGRPKVLDFGIAKLTETGSTRAGTILGTPNYMSPEQAAGRRVDRRSDIFSLGAILYELLTGERAFPGNTATAVLHKIREEEPIPVRKIDPTVDPAVEKIVLRALHKDPFQRYQTAEEMKADLAAARTGKTRAPAPASGAETVVMSPAQAAPSGVSDLSAARKKAPVRPAGPVTPVSGIRLQTPSPQTEKGNLIRMTVMVAVLLLLTGFSYGMVGAVRGWFSPSDLPWVTESGMDLAQAAPWLDNMYSGLEESGFWFTPPPPPAPVRPSEEPTEAFSDQPPEQAEAGATTTQPQQDVPKPVATPPVEKKPESKPKTKPEPPPEPVQQAASDQQEAGDVESGEDSPKADRRGRRREAVKEALADLSPEDRARVRRWLRQAEQYLNRNQLARAEIALKRIFELDKENELAKKLQERLDSMRKARE